jgi:hypothetical protein
MQAEKEGAELLPRHAGNSRGGSNQTPSPNPSRGRSRQSSGVQFNPALSFHRHPPAVWDDSPVDEDDHEWDTEAYKSADQGLVDEQMQRRRAEDNGLVGGWHGTRDDMQWDDATVDDIQAKARQALSPGQINLVPEALQPASVWEQQQQQALRTQQQQQLQETQRELLVQQQQ